MTLRRLRRSLVIVAVSCSMSCTSAQALIFHHFLGAFVPPVLGDHADEVVTIGGIDQSTGDLYVVLTSRKGFGANALYKYDSAGHEADFSASAPYIIGNRLMGTPTGPGGSVEPFIFGSPAEAQVAIDSSTGATKGDIYVTETLRGVVDVFASDGLYLGRLTGSSLPEGPYGGENEPCGVAVDSTGSVYIGDYSGFVDKYTPTANPLTDSDYVAELTGVEHPCLLAVDSDGNVYADTYSHGPLTKYAPSQLSPPSASLSIGTVFDPENEVFGVAVNPGADPLTGQANEVYLREAGDIAQYTSTGTLVSRFGSLITGNGEGTTAVDGATGEVYATTTEGSHSTVLVDRFGPAVVQPDVTTSVPAANVTGASATISGTVGPDGLDAHYYFQYGLSTRYGLVSPSIAGVDAGSGGAGCSQPGGAGCSTVPATANLTGLQPNATYHYRLDAFDVNGLDTGEDQSFTTPPLAPTLIDEFDLGRDAGDGDPRRAGEPEQRGHRRSASVRYERGLRYELPERGHWLELRRGRRGPGADGPAAGDDLPLPRDRDQRDLAPRWQRRPGRDLYDAAPDAASRANGRGERRVAERGEHRGHD